jgi:hypothetical protein
MVDGGPLLLRDEDEDEESEEEDEELEECVDETLPRGCSGSAAGRWAAAVCSWSRREASPG